MPLALLAVIPSPSYLPSSIVLVFEGPLPGGGESDADALIDTSATASGSDTLHSSRDAQSGSGSKILLYGLIDR